MNIVQAGPTPVVAVASEAANRPQQVRQADRPVRAVKPAPHSEQSTKYAARQNDPRKQRGTRVDILV